MIGGSANSARRILPDKDFSPCVFTSTNLLSF
jgi:hypothetical protein